MDLLYVLALLACPVGMGAMMWFMMRGQHGDSNKTQSTGNSQSAGNEQQQELALLRAEVDLLRQDRDNARSS